MKKYNTKQKYGKGWFLESERHRLARLGVPTGRKDYARDIRDISASPVLYRPTTVTTYPEKVEVPEEEDVMSDADTIVSEEDRFVTPEETEQQLDEIKEEEKTGIDTELSELENEFNPTNVIKTKWGDKVKENIKKHFEEALQNIRDKNIPGIEKHTDSLEEEKISIKDKIDVLNELKEKIKSSKVSSSERLSLLKRADKLLLEPDTHLRTIERTIQNLNERIPKIKQLEQLEQLKKTEKKPGALGAFKPTGIFPTWGELTHPERLRGETKPVERIIRVPGTVQKFRLVEKKPEFKATSIFPTFDEMMHPEKLRQTKRVSYSKHKIKTKR